jgi:hypothetical protein
MIDMDYFTRIQKSFSGMADGIIQGFERRYPEMEAAADRLARLGWGLPMQITVPEFLAIADSSYSDQMVETALVEFYTSNDCQGLRNLEADVLKAPALARWSTLIPEIFAAFYAEMFQITIPALISILEGLVASERGRLMERDIRIIRMARENEAAAAAHPKSYDALTWKTMRQIVEKIFQPAAFDGPQPSAINRHWILHGRDAGPWDKTDSLRLLIVLGTIA